MAREAGAVIECDPPLESIDPASIDPGRSPSVAIYARANARLPSLKGYLEPLERPVKGK